MVIPAGPACPADEVPPPLSVDALDWIGADRIGSVVAYRIVKVARRQIPVAGIEARRYVRKLVRHPAGSRLGCRPGRRPAAGCVWLEKPDAAGRSDRLTDPYALGLAVGWDGSPHPPPKTFC